MRRWVSVPLVPAAEGRPEVHSTCRAAARAASPGHQVQQPQVHIPQLLPALYCLPSYLLLSQCLSFVPGTRQNHLYTHSCLTQACSPGSIQNVELPSPPATLQMAGRWIAAYKACTRATMNTQASTLIPVACSIYLLDLSYAVLS